MTAPPPARRSRRPAYRHVLAAVLALTTVTAGADVALAVSAGSDTAAGHARAAALIAARQATVDLLSYDYRTIGTDVARAEQHLTGTFAAEYRQAAARLVAEARAAHAIVRATPGRPAVVSAEADQVVVLVFVDQATVKKSARGRTPATRIDQSRVQLTMTRVAGRWLVSRLEAL